MAKLVIATGNQGKLRELRALLEGRIPGFDPVADVVGGREVDLPDVVEDGVTFEQNALKKARAGARATGLPVIAEDSGLCVDVLGGAPGIFSARWSGRHGDDGANLRLLLAQLSDVPPEHRGAHYRCVAVFAAPDGTEFVAEGRMPGSIASSPRGEGGFGYDPIFLPEGSGVTAAEMTSEEKNTRSHRARAMATLLPQVLRYFGI